MAGSHNDINVLQRSPMFSRLAEGNAPEVNYEINGHTYTKENYLADGIYPEWSTFVKTISNPSDDNVILNKRNMEALFVQEQESCRKDVEHAFGVLQCRWAIVRHPARTWSVDAMWEVMTCCVIMHTMIMEDERDNSIYDKVWQFRGDQVVPDHTPTPFTQWAEFHREMHEKTAHKQLQRDLVHHMWYFLATKIRMPSCYIFNLVVMNNLFNLVVKLCCLFNLVVKLQFR